MRAVLTLCRCRTKVQKGAMIDDSLTIDELAIQQNHRTESHMSSLFHELSFLGEIYTVQ
jgi:hypothetical protein